MRPRRRWKCKPWLTACSPAGTTFLVRDIQQTDVPMQWSQQLSFGVEPLMSAGTEHRLTYSDLQHMYAHIVPDALPRLLQHALAARRATTTLNLEGDRSLLTSGTCPLLLGGNDTGKTGMNPANSDTLAHALSHGQLSIMHPQVLNMARPMRLSRLPGFKTCHCAISKSCESKGKWAALSDALFPVSSGCSKCSIT